MIKHKRPVTFLALIPFICGLCSFLSATLGLFEPYFDPMPLQLIPGFSEYDRYRCGDSEYVIF
jgi:hypothetical protein